MKEQLTLRKTTEDRTQDIQDTVRHTEVEVQDDRGGGVTGVGKLEWRAVSSAAESPSI